MQTQSLALASSQSWLPLLRPSIPIGWRLRLLRENLSVFVYATHATQAIAFEWKPGFIRRPVMGIVLDQSFLQLRSLLRRLNYRKLACYI